MSVRTPRSAKATRTTRRPAATSAAVPPRGRGEAGDEAVRARTGRTWAEWIAVLDRAGAKEMDHKSIATRLYEKHGLDGWWAQMVAVGYERARHGRKVHQRPDGFEVGASKTIAAPAARIFRAFTDAKARARWLPERVEIRTAKPSKTLRLTWCGPEGGIVAVYLLSKGPTKTLVNVQHGKLSSDAVGSRMQRWWRAKLEALAERT